MKDLKWFALALFVSMSVIPVIMYLCFYKSDPTPSVDPAREDVFTMPVTVYKSKENRIETIDCYNYICGVVAAEMPASYEAEALKAQTVAAFTYMLNKIYYAKENPDADNGHSGAFVCDDYNHCKAYLPQADLIKNWGESYYNKMYSKIESAVYDVLGKTITYNDKPINAVFHAVSCGKTASALEVWGSDIAYLKSVDCSFDKSSQDGISYLILTKKEFSDVFYEELGVILPSDDNAWIGEINYHPSGIVDTINIGGTMYEGTHIRKLFSLKSAAFDIEISNNKIKFNVYGYGHGVGMSQNGANELAKQGYDYASILEYFYTDVKITDYKIEKTA